MFEQILWLLMKTTSTKHDNLDNFRTRGTPGFEFGASGIWKWPIESLRYHKHAIFFYISALYALRLLGQKWIEF